MKLLLLKLREVLYDVHMKKNIMKSCAALSIVASTFAGINAAPAHAFVSSQLLTPRELGAGHVKHHNKAALQSLVGQVIPGLQLSPSDCATAANFSIPPESDAAAVTGSQGVGLYLAEAIAQPALASIPNIYATYTAPHCSHLTLSTHYQGKPVRGTIHFARTAIPRGLVVRGAHAIKGIAHLTGIPVINKGDIIIYVGYAVVNNETVVTGAFAPSFKHELRGAFDRAFRNSVNKVARLTTHNA